MKVWQFLLFMLALMIGLALLQDISGAFPTLVATLWKINGLLFVSTLLGTDWLHQKQFVLSQKTPCGNKLGYIEEKGKIYPAMFGHFFHQKLAVGYTITEQAQLDDGEFLITYRAQPNGSWTKSRKALEEIEPDEVAGLIGGYENGEGYKSQLLPDKS